MLLSSVSLWLVLGALAAAQSAVPSNFQYYKPAHENDTVILALYDGSAWVEYLLDPLTDGAQSTIEVSILHFVSHTPHRGFHDPTNCYCIDLGQQWIANPQPHGHRRTNLK